MLRVVVEEDRIDHRFVSENVSCLDALRDALAAFPPSEVARSADVDGDDLVRAARLWSDRGRGNAFAGTGPNMAGGGPLIAYLLLALQSLCGYWLQEGDRVRSPGTLVPTRLSRAQAAPPRPAVGFGEQLRVRGLTDTSAGLPTAALVDEILLPREGQVRALLCVGDNPAVAFPDQAKTVEALRSLELLVQIDPWMSETAKLATYVLPPRICLEIPTTNWLQEQGSAKNGYGTNEPYARYLPAAVEAPAGSDLLEEWQLIQGIARRMGLTLLLTMTLTSRFSSGSSEMSIEPDMALSSEDILEFLSTGSRIPFAQLRDNPGGHIYVRGPRRPGFAQAGGVVRPPRGR
jgi:anaerobic selenocysteine-containing dehydrogenase